MPIIASDIKFYLSGGAANSDVDASLGGAISSVEITTATLHNLFDVVSSAETTAGDIEYRCIYAKNTHGSLTLQASTAFVSANTPSGDTSADIGLGTAAISATEQTIADESTAPSAVSFSAPATQGAGLSIGDLTPGQFKAIWVRRTINAAASAYSNDSVTVDVGGDTAA